ncbi:methylase [Methanocaldococcus vulcanius M7]|uniref:Methylase n=1 Tax=Methanocaldococcus vulcanius (strain ATCC 700851 / DSM 12094 / M7) TaxID=579137 RepID=C9RHV9_METVM|nr:HemK2/MTQ2 family protein methyltransferase [Methanocaldococcus vulcanius]ACX73161.1 methylase [Methanocaldococcus vulcanius M7]
MITEFEGIKIKLHSEVYEPAEDTFLLLKNIVDVENKEVLEIGVGTGIISIACAKRGAKKVVGVDINPFAVNLALENAKLNNVNNVSFIKSDLFENVRGEFDVILFNPPYLPTLDEDKLEGNIDYAFNGGKSGREVLNRFLEEVGDYLKEGGVVQILQSSLTGEEETISMLKQLGFDVKVVDRLKIPFEELMVINGYKL